MVQSDCGDNKKDDYHLFPEIFISLDCKIPLIDSSNILEEMGGLFSYNKLFDLKETVQKYIFRGFFFLKQHGKY